MSAEHQVPLSGGEERRERLGYDGILSITPCCVVLEDKVV